MEAGNKYRYFVTVVSVGDAGIIARPAVIDRDTLKTVKVFRGGEELLADQLASELNRRWADGEVYTWEP